MNFYFIRTGHIGSTGDMFKAKTMDEAAEKAAKRWPGASNLYVWEVVNATPFRYEPEKEVQVTGVRRVD